MLELTSLKYDQHDYRAFYPESQQLELANRGGDFQGVFPHDQDIDVLNRFCNDVGGLLCGDVNGYAIFRQLNAYSPVGEAVRDEALHIISGYAGFDIDGELTKSEQESAVVLADGDIDALGIDNALRGAEIAVTYRNVVFGSIASKKVWAINEFEIPNSLNVLDIDAGQIEVTKRMFRILNLVEVND